VSGASAESVIALGHALRDGRLDSVTLTRDCLDRIATENARLNALVEVFEAEALAAAERADRERTAGIDRGPLHGIPVALKNNFDIAGRTTTACSKALRDNMAIADADAVARLCAGGAVIIGRTNMHELAYGGTGQISAAGPARNPHNTDHLAGGSSSGSAAAVAAGLVPVALGSDTGGSVRIPAATCGLVGFKPTFDRISTSGVVPLSWTLDHVGVLARSVEDAAVVVAVLEANNGPAMPSRPISSPGLHIGVARFPDLMLDRAVEDRFDRSLQALHAAGHQISYFGLEYTREVHRSWLAIMYPEATSRFESLLKSRYDEFDATVRTQLEAGRYVGATTYLRAQRFRGFYGRHIAGIAADYDLLCMPTLPTLAPKVGQQQVELPSGTVSTQDAMTFSNLTANMLGWPTITLPMGCDDGELPAGLTLLCPAGQDNRLLYSAAVVAGVIEGSW
jgi:aspartyl-tRNA(Asn)/glutamyl-tRNA(Gln) amidotransferase subunit A